MDENGVSLGQIARKRENSLAKTLFYRGLRENRHDVQTMIQFAQEQRMLTRPLTVDELFTENTQGT